MMAKSDPRGPAKGSSRVKCYRCDTRFFTRSTTSKVVCKHCGRNLRMWRAQMRHAADNQIVKELATGPKPVSSVPEDGQINSPYRQLVQSLYVSGGVGRRSKSRPPENARILYLHGDERGAVSRYIQHNTEFVRSCLEDGSNPIQSGWPEELYQLLVEQWHFLGYGDGGDE